MVPKEVDSAGRSAANGSQGLVTIVTMVYPGDQWTWDAIICWLLLRKTLEVLKCGGFHMVCDMTLLAIVQYSNCESGGSNWSDHPTLLVVDQTLVESGFFLQMQSVAMNGDDGKKV